MSQKFDDLNIGLTSFVAKILTEQKNDPDTILVLSQGFHLLTLSQLWS